MMGHTDLAEIAAGSSAGNADSKPVSIDIELKVGLNMFGYPVTEANGLTSFDLLDPLMLGDSDEIEKIQIYDKAANTYKEAYNGTAPSGDDVPIGFGDSIIILLKGRENYII